jgi:hypothetical protein
LILITDDPYVLFILASFGRAMYLNRSGFNKKKLSAKNIEQF